MPKIRMLFFHILLFFVMPFTILFMLAFRNNDSVIRKIRRGTAAIFVKLFGFRCQIKGQIDQNAKILVLNHQSDLDIIFLEYFHPQNICWVAKKELGDIPFFGLAMKLPKMILVDRKNKKEIISVIKTIRQRITEGRTVAIFPEGTRNDGEKFLPFKEGVKAMIEHAKSPVQPAVIIGSRAIFDPKSFSIEPGVMKLIFMPSFIPDTKNSDWYQNLRYSMEKTFQENR